MARPKKHADQQKSATVIFRITQSEYLRLSHKAAVLGVSVYMLVRKLALEGAETVQVKTHNHADPALVQQLHHIGVNLNQMTKRFHITGSTPKHLETLCKRIHALIDEAQN